MGLPLDTSVVPHTHTHHTHPPTHTFIDRRRRMLETYTCKLKCVCWCIHAYLNTQHWNSVWCRTRSLDLQRRPRVSEYVNWSVESVNCSASLTCSLTNKRGGLVITYNPGERLLYLFVELASQLQTSTHPFSVPAYSVWSNCPGDHPSTHHLTEVCWFSMVQNITWTFKHMLGFGTSLQTGTVHKYKPIGSIEPNANLDFFV